MTSVFLAVKGFNHAIPAFGVDPQERPQHGADVALLGLGALAHVAPEFGINPSNRELMRFHGGASSIGTSMADQLTVTCTSCEGLVRGM